MSLADYFAADEPAQVFVYWADCLAFLRSLPDDWCHAIITDPPYGLADHRADVVAGALVAWGSGDRERVPDGRGFMGRSWDAFVPPPAVWDECLRVLKPGGHLAVFAGSRTADLMGLSIRLAGFELRDGLAAWLYGSGFPKSLDVGKAIDKAGGDPLAFRRFAAAYASAIESSDHTHADVDRALGVKASSCYWSRTDHRGGLPPRHHWTQVRDLLGLDGELERLYDEVEREIVGRQARGFKPGGNAVYGAFSGDPDITAPATDAARAWSGWGTALKPAHEPILIARKPLAGTVAANTLAHGCGGLNVDACRVAGDARPKMVRTSTQVAASSMSGVSTGATSSGELTDQGRWPTNVVLAHAPLLDPATGEVVGDACADGCVPECHVRVLDEQSGTLAAGNRPAVRNTALGIMNDDGWQPQRQEQAGQRMGPGGASRFYPTFRYTAKAGKRERPQAWGRPTRCTCEEARPIDPETGALPPWWRAGTVCALCERPAEYRGHPTVKPLGLMRWLVRLLVPTAETGAVGTVLDPFAGSGATLEAARLEGVHAVGVERDVHSCRLIAARLGVDEPARDPSVPLLPVRERYASSVTQPDPFDVLIRAVLDATSVDDLIALATYAGPVWAPEHEAIARLRAAEFMPAAVAA